LIWAALTGNLSANPLSDITNETGVWTLRFICITLAITPLRRLTGWNAAIKFRRMMLALSTVRNLIHSVGEDVYKRPFITVGFTAWMTMVPLALTSTAGMIRRLGGRRWNLLHRLVYATGLLGVLHYWWLVKADVSRPLTYGAVVALLLGFRIYKTMGQQTTNRARISAAGESLSG
jgi:sulfoxide reductase heme-binding subunit YedZ